MRRVNLVNGILLVCGLSAAVLADIEPIKGNDSQRLDSLEAQLKPLYAKSGIYFGGNFYSRALSSKIDGNLVKDMTAKTTEDILYTGLDLSVNARPLDVIGATAIVRMYEDWRNMFGSMANPLTLRWISIDGNAKDFFTYNIGDFTQKYSKYTLWTPQPEIMFEPTVFARQRDIAMGEEFLGDNNRIMQGANFNFGAKVAPGLQELKIGGFAVRLRQVGKEIGDDVTTPLGVDGYGLSMDRYAFAFNADMKFVPGTLLGGTFLYIGDAKRTSKESDPNTWNNANDDIVFSGRLRLGSGLFSAIDSDKVNFGLGGEFAGSNYRTYAYNSKNKKGDVDKTDFGFAFNGGLDGDFKFGKNGLKLDAGFILNQQNFRNELAQSPSLYNRNILNSMTQSFNIFDALYTSVFSYTPAEGELLVDGAGIKQPIKKSAWTRGTLTWEEIHDAYENGMIEENISGAMPLGDATPNRSGFVGGLKLDFVNKAILLGGDLKILSELQRDTIFLEKTKEAQDFMEFVGGASFDVAKFGNWWAYPFILSGSFKHTSVDNYRGQSGNTNDISFINGGLYWKFWKRAAVMGGYQFISGETFNKSSKKTVTTDQSQWAAGFEYTVTEGGVLNATIGQVSFENSEDKGKNNYKSLRLDLNLSVKF
ncbi:MAG: hypothetical protein LBH98_09860 [Chitinispirillales bacterium]|jgi:hypothetical protein|nr:hypothetical protein [Chitinispirillales bacterium]